MSLFQSRALRLRERGYTIVPIKAGKKGPLIEAWQALEPGEDDIKAWAKSEYRNGNVGINTRFNPAVDIDVYDEDLAQELEEWLADQFQGHELCVRVGRAPKRLVVFRTTEPFRKLQATYTDGQTEHKLEILGAGQQFVAYGIHPDTRGEYTWVSMDEPLDVNSADLPELTLETAQDVLEKFCLMAEARGWEKLSKQVGANAGDGDGGIETWKPVLALSRATILETLEVLPNNDSPFDDWLEVGMALHHQFAGDTDGLEIWHDWSGQSSKCEPAEVNRRWESFGHGPATVTFATLLHRAKQVREQAADRRFDKALTRASLCSNKNTLLTEILPELAQSMQNDIHFDSAANMIQSRLAEIDPGVKRVRIDSIKKQIKLHAPKPERDKDIPKWCDNWVYVQVPNNFYNTVTGAKFSAGAFDNTYGRELISEAHRDRGEAFAGKAHQVALNLYRIPVVYDYLYFPGEGEFLKLDGLRMVNTYNPHKVPESAYPASKADRDAIAIVERHFEILFKNPYERNMLLDYLAYNIQYPSERVHWAPVIQGVDGGGKSFIRDLMAAVMGASNVGTATSGDLHEQYTAWAQGKKLVFFEEIKVTGIDKYDIVNKVKAYITNASVKVRVMQKDSYEIPNMTNYFCFTNHIDAIPFDDNDRRYFVLRTTFLTNSHIRKFAQANPNYFARLFGILGTNYAAIRYWLENRELSDAFNPKGHAPRTEAWELMRDEANSVDEDDESEIDSVIREHGSTNPLLTDELLSLDELRRVSDLMVGVGPRKVGVMLKKLGFSPLGRFRLNPGDADQSRFYTRNSEVYAESTDTLATIREMASRGVVYDDGLD